VTPSGHFHYRLMYRSARQRVLCQSFEVRFVIPAQTGIQSVEDWVPAVPAFAGMTVQPQMLV